MEKVKNKPRLFPYSVGLTINIGMRPMCLTCNQRPRAIAYHRDNNIQYRRLCEQCIRRGRKIKPANPRWKSAGYKKKTLCDCCGFRAKFSAQLLVYHVDGNMNNTAIRNLKTICQNCVIEIAKSDFPWQAGELEPDV
jgi:hypothetical protein